MARSLVVLAVALATSFLLPLNFVFPVTPRFAPSISHVALQEKANEKQGPQDFSVAPVPAAFIAMLAGLILGLFAMPQDVEAGTGKLRPYFQLERPAYMQGIDAANAAWRPGEIDFVTRSRLEAAQFPKALQVAAYDSERSREDFDAHGGEARAPVYKHCLEELEREKAIMAKAPTKAF
ncbi:unnamed protein product [Symbiodinium natans]|uniref:Uncharacterized protein n=1 Tax=Symbiodinium natans TaxID=878477 RepID=A0A812STF3_9DINO|nr:unnamed protein product [Symbiodinium natans]